MGRVLPLQDRLEAHSIPEPNSGCWLWTGGVNSGYGLMGVRGKNKYAHRVSYEVHCGPIPEGMCVCHYCDNTFCINPDHLFLGTVLDNNRDRQSKNRGNAARGEKHHKTALNAKKVLEIKKSRLPLSTLSEKYGVCISSISQIRNGKRWRHLSP